MKLLFFVLVTFSFEVSAMNVSLEGEGVQGFTRAYGDYYAHPANITCYELKYVDGVKLPYPMERIFNDKYDMVPSLYYPNTMKGRCHLKLSSAFFQFKSDRGSFGFATKLDKNAPDRITVKCSYREHNKEKCDYFWEADRAVGVDYKKNTTFVIEFVD